MPLQEFLLNTNNRFKERIEVKRVGDIFIFNKDDFLKYISKPAISSYLINKCMKLNDEHNIYEPNLYDAFRGINSLLKLDYKFISYSKYDRSLRMINKFEECFYDYCEDNNRIRNIIDNSSNDNNHFIELINSTSIKKIEELLNIKEEK